MKDLNDRYDLKLCIMICMENRQSLDVGVTARKIRVKGGGPLKRTSKRGDDPNKLKWTTV